MTVETILAAKGHEVITIRPEHTLQQAAAILAAKHIGAIVVTDESGALKGILSERDIVRAVAKSGAHCLAETVSGHMTGKVVTTTRSSSILATMEQMTEGRFRHIPVVHNGKLEGVISIGDLVKHRIAEIEREGKALRDYIATA